MWGVPPLRTGIKVPLFASAGENNLARRGLSMIEQAPILLVADDDPDFVLLLRTAFECSGSSSRIIHVWDGGELINYLSGDGVFANRRAYPLPNLLVLDWRLPRVSGLEALRWIRGQPGLGKLPVVILTGTEAPDATMNARLLGATAFLLKPLEFCGLTQIAAQLGTLCRAEAVELPRAA